MKELGVLHQLVTTSPRGETAVRDRIEALKDLSLTLSTALEAIGTLGFLGMDQSVNIESGIDFYDEVRRFEIFLIQRALKHTGGCQSRAATLLGLKPTTLNSKIRVYNINWRVPVQTSRQADD
ncbi:MAG TPA: helix-turn-helix domain-containing protein [Pyrinomonadaceae bacterium]|jgi:transcriptional regulator with GAF, ATPase, and Fis domain|nr:helix-turn-helix domain-containing protein [Pyrinomonadaceae bacterium]